MTPEEFLAFCESVKNSNPTGDAGAGKTYFTAVWLGAEAPGITPPQNDSVAIEGYQAGRELSKRFK